MGATPLSFLAQNQSCTYNLLAKDPDGDSLSYALVNANKAFNTAITYPSGYTARKPLDVFCTSFDCNLDKSAWPIDGIDIDAHTGWMGFTPLTSGQKGFMVMEITEWRKVNGTYVKVGVVRRDLFLEVIDMGNNVPKISTGKLKYYACSGQPFSLDFAISDPVYGSVKDSVKLNAYFEIPGFTMGKVGNSKNQFDAYFSTTFTKLQARSKPYILTVTATDDHCPLQLTTYKTFEIVVVPAPDAAFTATHTVCNRIKCLSSFNETDIQHSWYLYDSSNLVDSRQSLNADFEVTKPGKWYIVHQVLNTETGCLTELKDSLTVPAFSLLKPLDAWKSKYCKEEEFTLQASFTGGTAPFTYTWNNQPGISVKAFTINADTNIVLNVSDRNGCEMTFSKTLGIFQSAVYKLTDTAMCMPVSPYDLHLSNRFTLGRGVVKSTATITYAGSAGVLSNPGNGYLFKPNMPAINNFRLDFADSNTCHYSEAFKINVVQAEPTGITKPLVACSNDKPLNLDIESGCTLTDGSWVCPAGAGYVKNGFFNPEVSGAGNFQLFYSKDISGCMVRDTTQILINKAPEVAIEKISTQLLCETTADFNLKGIPGGGIWKNTATPALGSLISAPEILRQGKTENTVFYTFTDATNQCSATDSINVKVSKAVVAQIPSGEEVCEGNTVLLMPKPENVSKLNLIGNYSSVGVERYGENWIFTTSVLGKKESFPYQVKFVALPGCPDVTLPFTITVKPRPSIFVLAQPDAGCAPLNTNLSAININPNALAQNFNWNDGSGWTVNPAKRNLILTDTGVHKFEVKAELEGCFSKSETAIINVYPSPEALFTIDPSTRKATQDYPSLYFSDNSNSGASYSREWNFEKGQPGSSNRKSVLATFPKDTGVYKVTLTLNTDKGCQSVAVNYIRILPGLQFYAPNAFTPNDKGPDKNEVFRIIMDSTVSFRMTIRNRWGEILFSSNDQFAAWDGNYLGKEVPNGVYFWELEANTIYGRNILRKGVVSLIR